MSLKLTTSTSLSTCRPFSRLSDSDFHVRVSIVLIVVNVIEHSDVSQLITITSSKGQFDLIRVEIGGDLVVIVLVIITELLIKVVVIVLP